VNVRGDDWKVGDIVLMASNEARNRAMHGDFVAVDPIAKRVVSVLSRNRRPFVATLSTADAEHMQQMSTSLSGQRWLVIVPMDPRLPKMRMNTRLGPLLIGMRFIAALDDWPVDSLHPTAHYIRTLGPAMDLATESSAILVETGLDDHEKVIVLFLFFLLNIEQERHP